MTSYNKALNILTVEIAKTGMDWETLR